MLTAAALAILISLDRGDSTPLIQPPPPPTYTEGWFWTITPQDRAEIQDWYLKRQADIDRLHRTMRAFEPF